MIMHRSTNKLVKFFKAYLNDKPHLEIFYEQLYLQDREGQEKAMKEICSFLSAKITDLSPANLENYIYNTARKQTPDDVLKTVPNYRIFKKYL